MANTTNKTFQGMRMLKMLVIAGKRPDPITSATSDRGPIRFG
ncbi:hypothetical protein [Tolypothrix sp. PCC 7601]|nr:hypothetical protein [Tolypothrix sp. PCC 7601]